MTEPAHQSPSNEGPPFFSSWGRMYTFVLGVLLLLIVLFALLGRAFS
jgi:hypothetical protein